MYSGICILHVIQTDMSSEHTNTVAIHRRVNRKQSISSSDLQQQLSAQTAELFFCLMDFGVNVL